jgi:hypothetical protein
MIELSDEVLMYLDVFTMLILNWINSDLDGIIIVTPEGGQMFLLESKL